MTIFVDEGVLLPRLSDSFLDSVLEVDRSLFFRLVLLESVGSWGLLLELSKISVCVDLVFSALKCNE